MTRRAAKKLCHPGEGREPCPPWAPASAGEDDTAGRARWSANTASRLCAIAAPGGYGKPRPAVIVQTDAFPATHASVIICQTTSDLADAPEFRVTIEPGPETGLRTRSQVMADKPVTIRRERVGDTIGRLGRADMARLNAALAFVMGLAG
jgi:mRNA interferase MazF